MVSQQTQLSCHFHQKYYRGNKRDAPPKLAPDAVTLCVVPPIPLPHHSVSAQCLNLCPVVTVAARVKSDGAAACPCCQHCCFKSSERVSVPALGRSHKPNAAQDMNGWFQTNALDTAVDKFVMFSALKGLKQRLTFRVFSSI